MFTCEEIARYVRRAEWQSISPEARRKLKQHLLDAVGCAFGAMPAGPIAAIRKEESSVWNSEGGSGACSMIGGGKSTPERAAFYNGALIRYLDFMDAFIAREEACHPSDNIGALLAAAELAGASGRDFLTAMAIAYHVQCRLTESPAPVMRAGFDHTLPLAIAIACGASYLLGLDEQCTAHAIALCASDGLSLGAARTGEHVSQWKGLAAPSAAFKAIHNVRLAQSGITGPLHAFEGPMGLEQVLGKPFGIDWSREGYDGVLACSIKRYNAEFHSQSFIEGLVEIRNSGTVRLDEIRRIEIDIFKAGYEMIGGGKYVNPETVETKEDADHSLQYLAAVALLDGDVWPEQFEAKRILAADVQQLMRKVKSHESAEFTREYPQRLSARIRIERAGGEPVVLENSDYRGFFRTPMTWAELGAKYRRLAKSGVSADEAGRVADYVSTLEESSASEIFGGGPEKSAARTTEELARAW